MQKGIGLGRERECKSRSEKNALSVFICHSIATQDIGGSASFVRAFTDQPDSD